MWVKLRHKIIFGLLRPWFRLYFILRYNLKIGRTKLEKGQPYIILGNHQTTLDPFILSMSFRRPIYFMSSIDLFSNRFIGRVINFLVAPIPKNKSQSDTNAIRITKTVVNEGGTVSIFPEGNRTYSGKLGYVDYSIVKLIRMLKIPVITYNINGGFGYDPRFSKVIRKGRASAGVKRIVPYSEIEKMTNDELYNLIISDLSVTEVPTSVKFKHKRRAEYLERVLYHCPVCGAYESLRSNKEKFVCNKCNLVIEYTENLEFKSDNKDFIFRYVYEWFDYQVKQIVARKYDDSLIYSDNDVRYFLVRFKRGRKCLNYGCLKMYKDRLTIESPKATDTIKLDTVSGMTVLGKNKLNIYVGTKTYQFKGNLRFSALKYMQLFYHFKNSNEDPDKFLGI